MPTNAVQALNPLPSTCNEFANVTSSDNTEHEETVSLDRGYLESGDCMSETDGANTYLEIGDEKTDSEDSIAWMGRGGQYLTKMNWNRLIGKYSIQQGN